MILARLHGQFKFHIRQYVKTISYVTHNLTIHTNKFKILIYKL